jgi:hypothetical protein
MALLPAHFGFVAFGLRLGHSLGAVSKPWEQLRYGSEHHERGRVVGCGTEAESAGWGTLWAALGV